MTVNEPSIPPPPPPAPPVPQVNSRSLIINIVIVLVLVAVTVGFCFQARELNTAPETGVVMELPGSVGKFWGVKEEASPGEKSILPGDTELVRKRYTDMEGNQIVCSIVLSGGEKRSIHRPEICLPAQGWNIDNDKVVSIPLRSGKILKATDLSLSQSREIAPGKRVTLRSQFMYWFVGKGKTTPSNWDRIMSTSWDRVFHKTNHRWAYVLASASVTAEQKKNGKTSEQTTEMLEKFIRDIVPTFQKSEMEQPAS